MTMDDDNKKDPVALRKPYPWWYHPEMCFLDWIINRICYWILPLHEPARFPASWDSKPAMQSIMRLRTKFANLCRPSHAGLYRRWSAAAGCDIVECSGYQIPIPADALKREWGLDGDDASMAAELEFPKNVNVLLHFPVSLLPHGVKVPSTDETNEFGCLPLKDVDLGLLPPDVPIVVYFHGGGMTIGDARDPDGMKLIAAIQEATAGAGRPIVFASVRYNLAPERTFPLAAAQAVATVRHFLDLQPRRPVHVAGVSAGGFLATVATMECSRKHSSSPESSNCDNKIASALLVCPMLDPACDSVSYYLNSRSCALVDFLRWSWRAYLGLPDADVDVKSDGSDATADELLSRGTNRTSWNASKIRKTALERLAKPTVDLPIDALSTTGSASPPPKIIVLTSRADPLHDEGVQLVRLLRAGNADVRHLDHGGSHWLGTTLDRKAFGELVQAWKQALYSGASP